MSRIKRGSGLFSTTITDDLDEEIDVEVTYQGYSDPGVVSGPVERCYPPEGEMEILSVTVNGIEQVITDSQREKIEEEAWEHLEDQ